MAVIALISVDRRELLSACESMRVLLANAVAK